MSPTRERTKKLGLEILRTWANKIAVLYFKKQGFSKKIFLPFDRSLGYFKDYSDARVM